MVLYILLPTTITNISGTDSLYFHSSPSSTPFPTLHVRPVQTLWPLPHTPDFLLYTDPFFQYLLGPHQHLLYDSALLACELASSTLAACSDGSFNPITGFGTHGWVFASTNKTILMKGAGPMCGNPTLSSPYPSELSGLVALLYLLKRICQHHNITVDKITIYCNNNSTLTNVFRRLYSGIGQFLYADSDLVQVAILLLREIPIKVLTQWVKGHSTAKQKNLPETLNTIADNLAGAYAKSPDKNFSPKALPLAPPNYRICLVYNNSTITSKLYKILHAAHHSKVITNHILKKTTWTPQVFDLVDWDAHERSFKHLTRNQQITTIKIIHQLMNKNWQNKLYYGSSDFCPCCQLAEETFQHVLRCPAPSFSTHCSKAFNHLIVSLTAAGTPAPTLAAITHGTSHWNSSSDTTTVRELTAGSLHAGNTLLTTAFNEQYHRIGWYHLLLGHLSNKWGKAYNTYMGRSCTLTQQTHWISLFISILWQYTRSLWTHRNEVLHGLTAEATAQSRIAALRAKVTTLYSAFAHNPSPFYSRGIITYSKIDHCPND